MPHATAHADPAIATGTLCFGNDTSAGQALPPRAAIRRIIRQTYALKGGPSAKPPASPFSFVTRLALAFGLGVVLLGGLPMIWRLDLSLSDHTAIAIGQATLAGFGGAIGGTLAGSSIATPGH